MQGLNPFKDANERVSVGTGIPVCSVGTSPLHVLASTSMLHGLDGNRRPIAPLSREGKCREVKVDFQQSRNRDLPRQIYLNKVLTGTPSTSEAPLIHQDRAGVKYMLGCSNGV